MNRNLLRIGLAVATAAAVATTTVVAAQGESGGEEGPRHVATTLSGYNETLVALSTPGSGSFSAAIDEGNQEIRYELSFTGTPTAVTQAHIHFGSKAQSGGVTAFLCSNLGNGPAGTPACPASGTVTGTITPAVVVGGAAAQGIAAGEFKELVDAIHAHKGYVNVHTVAFAGGEIRGQLP